MTQRWASAPSVDDPPSVRAHLATWPLGTREVLEAFVGRQPPAEVLPWIEGRAEEYRTQWPEERPRRLWCEAALDLVAWQSGRPVSKTLEWLRAFDAVAREVMATPW